MSDVTTKSAETVVIEAVQDLVKARGENVAAVTGTSNFLGDLGMDSLELAELSQALTDELGKDPFSEGIFPETVAELVAFYD